MSLATIAWQQPYLNTFKYFAITSDKNFIKQGEIANVMVSIYKLQIMNINVNFKRILK